jgi:hypothetical protein
MTEPSTRFIELNADQPSRNKFTIGCFALFICTHLLIMIVLVTNIALIAPEVKTTLSDVKIIVPEMQKTISELGMLLPEITQGMQILKQLCTANDQCNIH